MKDMKLTQEMIMYAISDGYYNHGTFTVLLNPDGTPMLWESEDTK